MIEGLHSEFEQIRRNFCHFENFCPKNRFFGSTRSAPRATHNIGRSKSQVACSFGFVMMKSTCSTIAKAFHQVLSDQKAQKHHENHISATFCTSRKYFRENTLLEGQMDTTLENSTWVGK